ncbi:MAG: protein kinase [Myxococcota bacterium]
MPREVTLVGSVDEGRRLGRYLLCGEISRGGMGRVYLGRAEGPGGFEKLCAVKVILAEKDDQKLRTMFLDEARIASRITHQNVCQVFDFGDAEGVLFLVMEYLVGQPISRVIQALAKRQEARSDPTFPLVVARMLADACEGLHAAHRATDEDGNSLDVVHRDVSPENLFVTYDGSVRVMDFGVASAAGRLQHTEVGGFKGKIAYAPPEAFESKTLDSRADVWGAGVVLWELMVGASLFNRESEAATLAAVLQETFPWPSQVHAGLPTEIDHVLYRALQRDRDVRYASCRDMARDLNQYVAGSGVHVGAAELGEWMEALFPNGRAAAARVMREARRLEGSYHHVPQLDASSMDALSVVGAQKPSVGSVSEVRPAGAGPFGDSTAVAKRRSSSGGKAKPRSIPPSAPPESAPARRSISTSVLPPAPSSPPPAGSEFPPASPPRRTLLWLVLGVLALGGAGVGLGIYLVEWSRSRGPNEPAVAPLPSEPGPSGSPVTPSEASSERSVEPTTPEADSVHDPSGDPPSGDESSAEASSAEDEGASQETDDEAPSPQASDERTAESTSERTRSDDSDERPRDRTPGTVSVFAVGGWADISSRGRALGRTPAQLSLPPGRHILVLTTADGRTFRRTAVVRPGGETNVSVDLR